jgi:alpha-D-xyloside xylohydrolase
LPNSEDSFVISDSTSPGAGKMAIAHIFPKEKGSYNDIQNSMASIINFNAYGMPNVGPNVCGYEPETSDEELCVRYF